MIITDRSVEDILWEDFGADCITFILDYLSANDICVESFVRELASMDREDCSKYMVEWCWDILHDHYDYRDTFEVEE